MPDDGSTFPPAPQLGPQEGGSAAVLAEPAQIAVCDGDFTGSSHRDYRLWYLAVEHPFGHERAPSWTDAVHDDLATHPCPMAKRCAGIGPQG